MSKGYDVDQEGLCPFCKKVVRFVKPDALNMGNKTFTSFCGAKIGPRSSFTLGISKCPSCNEHIVTKTDYRHRYDIMPDLDLSSGGISQVIYPTGVVRKAPPEVPEEIARDFEMASKVLSITEDASAALGRRCLDKLLEKEGYKGELASKIDVVVKDIPKIYAEDLDGVRKIGDLDHCEVKSRVPGTIVPAGPGEAESILDVLELLFDHFYVQKKKAEVLRDKINRQRSMQG